MNTTLQQIQQDWGKLLEKIRDDEERPDYARFEEHRSHLRSLDLMESSSISVFDLHKLTHIYQSENFGKVLGYDKSEIEAMGDDFISHKTHPQDQLKLLENGINLMYYVHEIPVENRLDYKLVSDFRIRNAAGKYVRIIEQQQALELSPSGNIWLALSVFDLSPDQDLERPAKCRLFNFRTGENDLLDYIPAKYNHSGKEEKSKLSNRELQVLKLIKQGNFSKEIADKLFISVHTVNTHRQNILQKLEAGNSVEAVQYAEKYGLLG